MTEKECEMAVAQAQHEVNFLQDQLAAERELLKARTEYFEKEIAAERKRARLLEVELKDWKDRAYEASGIVAEERRELEAERKLRQEAENIATKALNDLGDMHKQLEQSESGAAALLREYNELRGRVHAWAGDHPCCDDHVHVFAEFVGPIEDDFKPLSSPVGKAYAEEMEACRDALEFALKGCPACEHLDAELVEKADKWRAARARRENA